jgi:hypothetical protein
MNKTIEYAVNEALNVGRLSAMPEFLEKELKEKFKQHIEQRVSVYRGVLERKEVAETKCPVCRESFLNLEYTRGMVAAFNQMIGTLNDSN